MSFGELASFMMELGCYQAMAFDGGGSAGLYVGGKGFVSRSEDRAVANGLLITTSAAPPPKRTPVPSPGAGR
jgi:exopolysaccharide biosynthesis protein